MTGPVKEKVWIACVATAAALVAVVVGPGQAAPRATAAPAQAAVKVAEARPTQEPVVQQAVLQEQPARVVRVVYPSPFSAQR